MGQAGPLARNSSSNIRKSPALLLLGLLLLLSCCQQASGLYHTSSEVLHWFSRWAAKRPDVLRFRELHERQTSTVIPVATITKGINSPTHKPRPAVLFVFGEHARELITPEVGIWLARLLVDSNSSAYTWPELSAAFERAGVDSSGRSINRTSGAAAAASSSSSSSGSGSGVKADWPAVVRGWVSELLGVLEVVIVPIEALDSRRLVEAGQLCVRKSASSVDLNRNWPYAWKKEAATDEQYGGPNPFSEPQSRLMKHLVDHLTGRLLGYVNVHSGEWALYTPWDSKEAYGPGLPADLPDLVGKVGRLCNCQAGPAGAVSGYLAYGTSMDYLYVHKRVPYPLTVEVYGGGNVGKLAAGHTNKNLTAWPTVNKAGAPISAAAQFQRRLRRLLAGAAEVLPLLARGPSEGAAGTRAGSGQPDEQQQQQQGLVQQQWQQRRRRRRHSRSKQLRLFGVAGVDGDAAAAGAALPSGAGGAVDAPTAAAAAAAGGFSAGANLAQLKQQAKQQLLQQQQQQVAGAAPSLPSTPDAAAAAAHQAGSDSGSGGGGDSILSLVAAAPAHQRSCFDAFNPQSEAEYRRVVADWLAASLIMLKHMADGQEGQRMIAQVAAGGVGRAGGGSRWAGQQQQSSGISIQEPASGAAGGTAAAAAPAAAGQVVGGG